MDREAWTKDNKWKLIRSAKCPECFHRNLLHPVVCNHSKGGEKTAHKKTNATKL